MIDIITRINVSDFDLNLVTASISPSIQDVRELHALSPPSATRYALGCMDLDISFLDRTMKTTIYVKMDAGDQEEPLIVEQGEELAGLQVESAVVSCSLDGYAHVLVTNQSDATLKVSKGTLVARAEAVDEIVSPESFTDEEYINVRRVTSTSEELRRQKVREMVDLAEVPLNEKSMLHDFLADHHRAFSLEEAEENVDRQTLSIWR